MGLSIEDFTHAHEGARLCREICLSDEDEETLTARLRGAIRAYVATYQTLRGSEDTESFLRDVIGAIPRKPSRPRLAVVNE